MSTTPSGLVNVAPTGQTCVHGESTQWLHIFGTKKTFAPTRAFPSPLVPGLPFGGMLNQGGKPTFGDGRRSIEVHLFGFEGDLYDEWVKVEWVRRLRDVRKFESPADLVAQLQHDRAHAESVLTATRQA